MTYAAFRNQIFTNFAGGIAPDTTQPTNAFHAVQLPECQVMRLRAIHRSGYEATATLDAAGQVQVVATEVRRQVLVKLISPFLGGQGSVSNYDLHRMSVLEAGERIAQSLDTHSHGRLQLTPEQAQEQAHLAVGDLLRRHPCPSFENLVDAFKGLWTAAHPDFKSTLVDALSASIEHLANA